ncbi:MAG: hypothetical protein ABSE77_04355 [Acidimicrobiales bacterium]
MAYGPDQVGVDKVVRRQVDCYQGLDRQLARSLPVDELSASSVQDLSGQGTSEAQAGRGRTEHLGRDIPQLRMGPARKCLGGHNVVVLGVHHRLVHDPYLVAHLAAELEVVPARGWPS